MKVVLISDTHDRHRDLTIPQCDLLIHAGDIAHTGESAVIMDFLHWIREQKAKQTIFIAGNHDNALRYNQTVRGMVDICPWVTYLQDRSLKLNDLKFYGSPWQPEYNNMAFNLPRGSEELKNTWRRIPLDTDVLITHGPPKGILDRNEAERGGESCGCELLAQRLELVKPKLHVFGHIHEARGSYVSPYGTTHINASNFYKGELNPPIIIEIEDRNVRLIE